MASLIAAIPVYKADRYFAWLTARSIAWFAVGPVVLLDLLGASPDEHQVSLPLIVERLSRGESDSVADDLVAECGDDGVVIAGSSGRPLKGVIGDGWANLLTLARALKGRGVTVVALCPWWSVPDEPDSAEFERVISSVDVTVLGIGVLDPAEPSHLTIRMLERLASGAGERSRFVVKAASVADIPASIRDSASLLLFDPERWGPELSMNPTAVVRLLGLRFRGSAIADERAFHTIARPFAVAMCAKASLVSEGFLSERQKARTLESISEDLKKLCDVLIPDVLNRSVSAKALEKAQALGVDLAVETWQTQNRFDPGRAVFHHEHVTPVNELRRRVLAGPDAERVVAMLATNLQVAWILKSEDAQLTNLGYRHRRADPMAAYAQAGIELLPLAREPSGSDD